MTERILIVKKKINDISTDGAFIIALTSFFIALTSLVSVFVNKIPMIIKFIQI